MPALVRVLVQIRHRELAQRAVNRVAPAKHGGIGLRDRTPAAAAPEQRDDVVVIALGAHIHQKRRLAVHPERAGGYHRAFDAVRPAPPQHLAHRKTGLAADFEIGRQRVEKILDFLRAGKTLEHGELGRGEAQVFTAGKTCSQTPDSPKMAGARNPASDYFNVIGTRTARARTPRRC